MRVSIRSDQVATCSIFGARQICYLDLIFTVSQRLHGRDAYPGTGIVAIYRQICERHQGSITACLALDEGATFIVALPVMQEK
ncbi:MAG: hypothetical protein VX893_11740 [Candidatus Latescibacterota bacterium]|nr:hypothetical protein [Candidatus Latescibacterota bacterium]